MLFNSFSYILIFLPCMIACIAVGRSLFGPRASQVCILIGSLAFYAWFKPSDVILLVGSIAANACFARLIAKAQRPARTRFLQLALVANIGFLCIFKYVNFFARSLPATLSSHLTLPNLDFPLGISFFTLTQIMYLVDCYEDLVAPLSLLNHATFVSFFPYVISGPLARAKRMLQQFDNFGGKAPASPSKAELTSRGLCLFAIGLFKKVVLAYAFAHVADFGYASQGSLSAMEAWVFSIAYTLQIYFDFSGYTDLALGSAMLLGIEIPRNFDAPLRSKSIIEFWQRWHISLSQFITTYLYTPLLKSFRRASLLTASVATLIAMTIAGLWHGPSWTFVLFGTLHGAGLVTNQYWRKKKMPKPPPQLSWLLTFVLVNVAFILFRSPTVVAAGGMMAALVSLHAPFASTNLRAMHDAFSLKIFGLPLLAGLLVAFFGPSSDQFARDFRPGKANALALAALTVVAMLFMNSNIAQQFVYFKF